MKMSPRTGWQQAIVISLSLLVNCFILATPHKLYAHGGGTPRLTSEPVGPYRLYAWSEPEPWRVGEVHLSLAVTKLNPDPSSNQIELPVTDVEVTVTFMPMQGGAVDTTAEPVVVQAVRQEFLSDFYYEADPTLTREGEWQIQVTVTGQEGEGSTQFPMETMPERALNWLLIAGAGLLFLIIIALIALWSRSQQPAQPAHRPHRGVRRVQREARKATVHNEVVSSRVAGKEVAGKEEVRKEAT